jgi:hypothetical protein
LPFLLSALLLFAGSSASSLSSFPFVITFAYLTEPIYHCGNTPSTDYELATVVQSVGIGKHLVNKEEPTHVRNLPHQILVRLPH